MFGYRKHRTTNPLVNAFLASLYIVAIASFMYYVPKAMGDIEGVIIPVVVLSLFVLSTAVMGYLFLSKPAQLYVDGQRGEAIRLFLNTIFAFAGITILFLAALFAITNLV